MKEKVICRGDLFYYDFGDNSGSVQSGERPVLVVQADDYNQNAPTIIVTLMWIDIVNKRSYNFLYMNMLLHILLSPYIIYIIFYIICPQSDSK